jgi:integrase
VNAVAASTTAAASISSGKEIPDLGTIPPAFAVAAGIVERAAARRFVALTWSAYDGTYIRLRQSKSVRRNARRPVYVTIPVGRPLKAALDEAIKTKQSPVILLNSEGRAWTPDGFRASWGKACKRANIEEVTFNDLRGTAVTRLALVGCSESEIATITGHSIRDVRSILDAHYLHRDQALAESAIRKLELGYAQGLAARTGTESTK